MHCQGRVVLPYQINVTLEASILTKNICVGKVQTLVLTVYDFAPLSNFSYYTWNHTLIFNKYMTMQEITSTSQHIFAFGLA